MEAALAKAWSDDSLPIDVNLASPDAPLKPIVNAVLAEARKLKLPLESVAAWASTDLLRTIKRETSQLPTSLASLAPVLRLLALRNPLLVNHVISVERDREILKNLLIFEPSLPTPAFTEAVEISADRANAAFRRAACVAQGESPIKSRKSREKAKKTVEPEKREDEAIPGLIDLEDEAATTMAVSLPSIEELMEHGLSRKGAETVLSRLVH